MALLDIVLSVPAGKAYDLILEHFIYCCPDDDRHQYNQTQFITFRQGDGTMTRLFRIEGTVRAVPASISATHDVAAGLRDRIVGYLSVAQNRGVIETPGKAYRFYILSDEEVEELPHRPHTEPRSLGAVYFKRAELKAGRAVVKAIVL